MKKKIVKIKATEELQTALHDIKDILSDTKDGMQNRASEAISELIDNLKDQSAQTTEDFKTLVSEKPLQSLAIALMAGIVIGKVIL